MEAGPSCEGVGMSPIQLFWAGKNFSSKTKRSGMVQDALDMLAGRAAAGSGDGEAGAAEPAAAAAAAAAAADADGSLEGGDASG